MKANIIDALLPLAIPITDCHPDPTNARTGHAIDRIAASLRQYGQRKPIVVNVSEGGKIEAGNGTWEAARSLGWTHIAAVTVEDDPMTAVGYGIADNRTGHLSEWDAEILAILAESLPPEIYTGFEGDELVELLAELGAGLDASMGNGQGDAEPQVDRAEELRQNWGTETGQLWQIGEHRLIVGDCTDRAVVERVMGGERAALCHADPPYGMGKEKDGIVNDNLYRDKLDAFQMTWWGAQRPFLADNGSAYIWGNAEDLWRLWYVGGLRDSERLTLRNEIVWGKGNGQGMESGAHRMYPTATERALFFMLGEQGFNNNADNYWEGWEPVRSYLENEMKRCGWTVADLNRITNTNMGSHWVTRSQWGLITEEHYKTIQKAAREHDAFKREHDELKREFYATRAYFDNTHDNMTDVWQFQRVTGGDRHNHATPKPVEMIARAIKSSTPAGAIVYAPFAGTCPEIIACQNLNRRCRAIEISPAYCAVILQRMADAFPGIDIRQVEA